MLCQGEPTDAGNDELMESLTGAITLIFLFLAAVLALRRLNGARSSRQSEFPGESPGLERNDLD